jgi:hypothetical protein
MAHLYLVRVGHPDGQDHPFQFNVSGTGLEIVWC